uniref:Aldehyde dehydrogenase domain-containing protein n=1 Tax=Arundo donax TaxID=35708 RepID=A0A0A9E7M0_ARUDO
MKELPRCATTSSQEAQSLESVSSRRTGAMAEAEVGETVSELRGAYESGRTRSVAWRQAQLGGLLRLLKEKEAEAFQALHEDLGKHHAEAYRDEVGLLVKSANGALRELGKWMAPEKVWVPLVAFPASGQIVPEPLGVVLIFSCWNVPLGLSLEPLIGAIAAGNAVAVKPSELSPRTAKFLGDNIGRYMDATAVKVVQGGPEVGEQLMEHRWDKVLFTGTWHAPDEYV